MTTSKQTPLPEVGQKWRCKGFVFRIDHVDDKEIYMVRFSQLFEYLGTPMRTDHAIWLEAFADAEREV
jgi:hypothetical protein